MIPLAASILVAAVLWFVMFCPATAPHVPFWPMMAASAGLLAATAILIDRDRLRPILRYRWWHVPAGIVAAGGLYALFRIGHALALRILPFAADQVAAVYIPRDQAPAWTIAALLVWIGAAEEIFWRAFVQRRLQQHWNPWIGLAVATAAYTLVHAGSANLMLLAAAALCGAFWGLMFLTFDSIWPVLVSHVVWDVIIFVVWPIGNGTGQ